MAKQPPVYYVLLMVTAYEQFADALAQAPDTIAAHRARSKEFHDRGTLLMAGAFLDDPNNLDNPAEPLSTMGVFTTREAAEEFAKGDPFLLIGKIKQWRIREWADMFA